MRTTIFMDAKKCPDFGPELVQLKRMASRGPMSGVEAVVELRNSGTP